MDVAINFTVPGRGSLFARELRDTSTVAEAMEVMNRVTAPAVVSNMRAQAPSGAREAIPPTATLREFCVRAGVTGASPAWGAVSITGSGDVPILLVCTVAPARNPYSGPNGSADGQATTLDASSAADSVRVRVFAPALTDSPEAVLGVRTLATFGPLPRSSTTMTQLYEAAKAACVPADALPGAGLLLFSQEGSPIFPGSAFVSSVPHLCVSTAGGADGHIITIFAILVAPSSVPAADTTALPAAEGETPVTLIVRGNENAGEPASVNLRVSVTPEATVNTLRRKIFAVTQIPVNQQALYEQGHSLLSASMLLRNLPSLSAASRTVVSDVFAGATSSSLRLSVERLPPPAAGGPIGIQHNYYAGHINAYAQGQTQAGRAAAFACLYIIGHEYTLSSARTQARILACARSLTAFPPFVHTLQRVMMGERLMEEERAVVVEGSVRMASRVVTRSGAPLGVDVNPGRLCELMHVVWAYILDCVGGDAEEGDAAAAADDAGAHVEVHIPTPAPWATLVSALKAHKQLRYMDAISLRAYSSADPALCVDICGSGYPAVVVSRPKDHSAAAMIFDPLLGVEARRDIDEMIRIASSAMGRLHAFKPLTVDVSVASHSTAAPRIVDDFLRPPREALIVLLDTSRSMSDIAFPGTTDLGASMTRIEAVRQMFFALANRSAAYDYAHVVSLVAFNSDTHVACRWTESWREFSDSLHAILPIGTTHMWDALSFAGEMLAKFITRFELRECKPRILVLTDGRDDGSSTPAHAVCRNLQMAGILVDAVVVGDELESRLKPICIATGGGLFRPMDFISALHLFEDETFLSVRERSRTLGYPAVESDADLEQYNNHKKYRYSELGDKTFRRPVPAPVKLPAVKPITGLNAVVETGAARLTRVAQELRHIITTPIENFEVFPCPTDIFTWRVLLRGPAHSPYENGVFELYVLFPEAYPIAPPEVRFVTRIIHCNINTSGKICHRIFDRNYEARFSLTELLMTIIGLLMMPDPTDPLDSVLADMLRSNPEEYRRMILDAVRAYAAGPFEDAKRRILGEEAPRRPTEEVDDDGIPYRFMCSITLEMFIDPVRTPAGHFYERSALEAHLARSSTDPKTREPLRMSECVQDNDLRAQVEAFRSKLADRAGLGRSGTGSAAAASASAAAPPAAAAAARRGRR